MLWTMVPWVYVLLLSPYLVFGTQLNLASLFVRYWSQIQKHPLVDLTKHCWQTPFFSRDDHQTKLTIGSFDLMGQRGGCMNLFYVFTQGTKSEESKITMIFIECPNNLHQSKHWLPLRSNIKIWSLFLASFVPNYFH